ncbi:MAG: preprotein translocase subunit SecE [Clostridia bacterium]|nr:preprotein translocase subunit SecE [Clostridia bacterium]
MAERVKRPNIFKRFGMHIAKSWSELKKVSWPTFIEVLKNLAVVLVVVLFFIVVLTAFDSIFLWLYKLLLA